MTTRKVATIFSGAFLFTVTLIIVQCAQASRRASEQPVKIGPEPPQSYLPAGK